MPTLKRIVYLIPQISERERETILRIIKYLSSSRKALVGLRKIPVEGLGRELQLV